MQFIGIIHVRMMSSISNLDFATYFVAILRLLLVQVAV